MSGERQVIDLGNKTDPRSPRFLIALIRSEQVRTSIEGYLTQRGIGLDRSDPPGWFQWLNEEHTVFQARCADPPEASQPDDGYQPFSYYVRVRISTGFLGKVRAIGEDFYHERALNVPPK